MMDMDFGCKHYGIPHDPVVIKQNDNVLVERCKICNKRERWNKQSSGRVKNDEYIKFHIRDTAQRFGKTKRIFYKIYKPEVTKIKI